MKTVYVFEKLLDRKFDRHFFTDRQNAIRCALSNVKNSPLNNKDKQLIMRELETWGADGPIGTYKNPKDGGIHYTGNGLFAFNLYQGKIED